MLANRARKTKIICTLGPSSETKEILINMASAGMDAARLNFSHGTVEEKEKKISIISQINKTLDMPIAVISDLKGPEIRVDTNGKELPVKIDEKIFFTWDKNSIQSEKQPYTAWINVDSLPDKGKIMVEDGLLEFEILKAEKNRVECVAKNSGLLKHNKGVNIPHTYERIETFTEKDWKDIEYSMKKGADFIAASFVKTKSDVDKLADFLKGSETKIISKIEHEEAVKNLAGIIESSDAIMVARGDLGVEVPLENLPSIQYDIVKRCNQAGKPVIVATHMLNSMIENPRPTRAEVTDVANAVFMGADCIMLSGETANGKYPVESINMMDRISASIEKDVRNRINRYEVSQTDVHGIVGRAVAMAADSLKAEAILSFTERGEAAKMLSRYRIQSPIYALTTKSEVCRNLSLFWGVFPYKLNATGKMEDVMENGIRFLQEKGKFGPKSNIVITANIPSSNGTIRTIAEVRKI